MNFRQQRIEWMFLLRELALVIFLLHELDLFTAGLRSKEYYDMFTHQQKRQYNRTQYHNLWHKRHACLRFWIVNVFPLMYCGKSKQASQHTTTPTCIILNSRWLSETPGSTNKNGIWYHRTLHDKRCITFLYKQTSNRCSNGTCWIRKGEALTVQTVLFITVGKITKEQKGRFGNLSYLK